MVAQATDKKKRLCERCFANVPQTEAFCPECGAAMSHDSTDVGSDSAVYPELARANLLRMRGDYRAAEDQCLSILKRYPNNTTANVLLGDICSENGDLEQAMQWYELALDLSPENIPARYKLDSVRKRFRDKETVATVEQLGLPTTKSRAGVYAFALIASIFVIAVVAYFVGQRVQQKNVFAPVRVVGNGEAKTPIDGAAPTGSTRSPAETRADQALLDAIRARGAEGARVLSAMQDPRSRVILLSFTVLEGENPRDLAAKIVKEAFEEVPDATVISVRALKKGQQVYFADALRSLYEETLTNTWKAEHSSRPEAWIDHVMTNEWPKPEEEPAKTDAEPAPTETTSGDEKPAEPPASDTPGTETPPPAAETTGGDEPPPATNDAPPGDEPPGGP